MIKNTIILMLLVFGGAALVALPFVEAAHALVLRQESRQTCNTNSVPVCSATSSSTPGGQCQTTVSPNGHSIRTTCTNRR
jgi:hypothetical protein